MEKLKELLKSPAILKIVVIGVAMLCGFALTAMSGLLGAAPDAIKQEMCKDYKAEVAAEVLPPAPAVVEAAPVVAPKVEAPKPEVKK